MPFFQTFSALISQPGTWSDWRSARRRARSQPASRRAPSVMSPLMPEKQSKYARFMVAEHGAQGRKAGENVCDGCRLILSAAVGGVKFWRDEGSIPRVVL